MLRKILLIIICSAILLPSYSHADPYSHFCGSNPVISTKKDDGTKRGLFITQQEIETAPKWSPNLGEPHLSISTIYTLVKEWAKTEYIRYEGIVVTQIALQPYRCSSVKDRWYYIVDFNPVFDGNQVYAGGHWAAVLMDGTIIGAKKY